MADPIPNVTLGGALDGEPAGEIIDALDGFFLLVKRSPTLEGSVPLKAMQFCTPFIAGNAAGFHLLLADSALVRKARGGTALGFAEPLEARISGPAYEARVGDLVRRRLLVANGYWHRRLAHGVHWQRGDKLHVWTGFLVRPRRDVWLLVTGAFNRRCSIEVQEHVIPDSGAFVPLVVTLDLKTARKRDTYLEKEVACVVPLRPDVRFTTCTLADAPDLGRRYVDYYDERWERSRPGNYVGSYRKLVSKESAEGAVGIADCRMVVMSESNPHRIRTFDRFVTPTGWSMDFAGRHRLQFIDVRNIFPVKGTWDGDAVRDLVGQSDESVSRLRASWAALYGEEGGRAADRFLVGYVRSTHGPRIGEPYLAFAAWLLVSTPQGWSSLVDGVHFPNGDGMRGVISTDKFSSLLGVWQFTEPTRFQIARGAPLMRVLPIPRQLLHGELRRVEFDDNVRGGENRPLDFQA